MRSLASGVFASAVWEKAHHGATVSEAAPRKRVPARLNATQIVDCAAYALARTGDPPLLFKGGSFGRTDVLAALSRE
jgi:uncharacterized protein with PIN domain